MQVILMERVAKLGQMGDVVEVKPGFARNFLLPQGKALTASKKNISEFQIQKAQLEARNIETRKEAEDLASRLDGKTFVVIRSASETGALYGSVTPRDAAEAATSGGFSVDRKQIALIKPIKELGLHEMAVRMHAEVMATIILNVARSEEEAALQADGKSIQELAAEEAEEAEFEIAELFDDMGAAASDDLDEDSVSVTNAPSEELKS
jgi:large subunit ribosomal protein L9